MGSLLLTGGAAGKRMALKNARSSSTSRSGGFQGQASDIEIHARETLNARKKLNEIYARHTGKDESSSTRTWSATASSLPSRRSSTA